jgi:hypothetical protein
MRTFCIVPWNYPSLMAAWYVDDAPSFGLWLISNLAGRLHPLSLPGVPSFSKRPRALRWRACYSPRYSTQLGT